MDLGIFELVLPRPTLEAMMDTVAEYGMRHIQFDYSSASLPPLPAQVPTDTAAYMRDVCERRGISIIAVSGTWNMIHPDPRVRDEGLAGLEAVAASCRALGTSVITLCTGSRNPDSMWRRHPNNDSVEAWRDLIASVTAALAIADKHDVTLAFEPEPANVVSSAARGRDLLREASHPRLKVVMDAANIVATDRTRPPEAVLDEAFDLLGEHVAAAHGKDLSADGRFCAAGQGVVPWDDCIAHFRAVGFDGPIVLHSLSEEAPTSIAFMRERIRGSNQA
jgi:sugar phosphate isomerase/epimerase